MSEININQNEQAREAERAVLGGLMLETHRFDTVIQVIKENDFDGKDHQIIFQSMSELVEENKPLDPLTVSEKLDNKNSLTKVCLLYTSPSPRDMWTSRMPSSA